MSRRAWEAAQGLGVGDGTRVGKRVTDRGWGDGASLTAMPVGRTVGREDSGLESLRPGARRTASS